jgi:hypothetical protein
MKALGGVALQFHSFFISAPDAVFICTSLPLYLSERLQVPTGWGPQYSGSFGREKKLLLLPAFEAGTVGALLL